MLYAMVLLFSFVEHHLSGFKKEPCKYITACSPFQSVPTSLDFERHHSFLENLCPELWMLLGCSWCFRFFLVALLIYKMLPNVGQKAAEVLAMAYFVSNCYYWAGVDTFGVLVFDFILTFTATTVVAFACIWQQLEYSMEDCETAAEMKQTRKRFKKDCQK